MTQTRLSVGVSTVILLGSIAIAGCSSSDRKEINEGLARNAIAVAGAKQFDDSGYSLDGLPTCRTQSRTTTKVTVGCTGETDKGEPVRLLGSTSDARQVKGTFVGTVSGEQVFETDCLGC